MVGLDNGLAARAPAMAREIPLELAGKARESGGSAMLRLTNIFRRSAETSAMLTVLLSSAAQADTYHFKDVLRPHGHARSLSAKFADGRSCGASGSHFSGDVTAFERCMRAHGWVVDHYTPDAKPQGSVSDDSSTYIDPDTGMSCRNFGGIAVCDPPQGTVHYRNRHGLDCTRTGIVSVCSNF